jgi:hypothetical protein
MFHPKVSTGRTLVHELYVELNFLVLTLAGRVLKPGATEELGDELTLQSFKVEKNFVPLLQTVVTDETVDCLESVDELLKRSFIQCVQNHSAAARYFLKQTLGGDFCSC